MASEERSGGVRGAPGSCPEGVHIVSQRRSWQQPSPHFKKKSGDSVWGCLTCSLKTFKLPSAFGDVCGGAFSTASAMDVHEFATPPRLCRQLNTAAPVHNNCTGHCKHEYRTLVLMLNCAFSPCLCSKRQWDSSRPWTRPCPKHSLSIENM